MPNPNHEFGTLVTLTAQGAGTVAANKSNPVGRGLRVTVDVTAVGGSPSMTVTIYEVCSGGLKRTLLASAAITGTGTTHYLVFPGATAVANSVANGQVGPQFEVSAVVGGTTPSVTGTISAAALA